MTADNIQQIAEEAKSWPEEDQVELVEYARDIQARRAGRYELTDDERAAVVQGQTQAARGEFVSDAELHDFRTKYRAQNDHGLA